MKNTNSYNLAQVALFAAVISIIAPLAIPLGPVPISLGTLGVYLSILLIGKKKSLAAVGLYLLLGFVGLPVFANYSSGPEVLLGPSGGYLIGYLLIVLVSSLVIRDNNQSRIKTFLALGLGTVFCYFLGTLYLSYQASLDFKASLLVGVLPFIPGDTLKIFLGIFLSEKIKPHI